MPLNLQRDEKTGLWQWPILLSGDYSQWTDEPCAILFAQTLREDTVLQSVWNELLSAKWPRLLPFRVGRTEVLVLAPRYSVEQALLLAEDINRQTNQVVLPRRHYGAQTEQSLTWGIAIASAPWNIGSVVAEAVAQQQKAWKEKRFGSINISEETCPNFFDDWGLFVGQDGLTKLRIEPIFFWSWSK